VYEHGYNVLKSHCLAISPDHVSFFDFPLMQGASQQQCVIEHLRALHAVVALAHPAFGGGRSAADMKDLVGYHYTEVLSAYANSPVCNAELREVILQGLEDLNDSKK
jgi:hypothetical protein